MTHQHSEFTSGYRQIDRETSGVRFHEATLCYCLLPFAFTLVGTTVLPPALSLSLLPFAYCWFVRSFVCDFGEWRTFTFLCQSERASTYVMQQQQCKMVRNESGFLTLFLAFLFNCCVFIFSSLGGGRSAARWSSSRRQHKCRVSHSLFSF